MFPSVAFASWWNPFSWKIFNSSHKKEVVLQAQAVNNKPVVSPTVENKKLQNQNLNLEKKPKEIANDEWYNVTILTPPNRKSDDPPGGMKFEVKLKNLNVTPFITNLGICGCTLSDLKGKTYRTEFSGEGRLKKALLPGEEASLNFFSTFSHREFVKNGEVECRGENTLDFIMLDWSKNIVKCIYNQSGECACEDLGPMHVVNCDFSISTDGKQASCWGKYPTTVKID